METSTAGEGMLGSGSYSGGESLDREQGLEAWYVMLLEKYSD